MTIAELINAKIMHLVEVKQKRVRTFLTPFKVVNLEITL